MTIQIQEGKYYRTRDGRKVGPMVIGIKGVTCKSKIDNFLPVWHRNGMSAMIGFASVSDAPNLDLVAEWTDEPKLWKDMTPEEKGALLLARHEGKTIQIWYGCWSNADLYCLDNDAYRVRPEPVRKRVTIRLCEFSHGYEGFSGTEDEDGYIASHLITFITVDGEPDVTSIKMEKIW